MRWNWQQTDWPQFSYDATRLKRREDQFLKNSGILIGVMAHLGAHDRQNLSIELMAQEAVDSSAIEGEILDRASVQSSVAKHLGIKTDRRHASAAEAGAAELMANLFLSYREPLSDALLFHWHALLTNGRRDLADIGHYRTHTEPMQIVSGALHAPEVHFEAPPSSAVPREMATFIAWFNESAPGSSSPLGTLTRAGIAHLWFETIHPFEDGNGRLGRAIAEKAFAQGLDAPAITAIAETVQRSRKDYYAQLHRASLSNRIDDWLEWFSGIALTAQRRTLEKVHFLLAKAKLFDRLRGHINPRQEKALLRIFAEGPDGFKGGLSAANYRSITGAAPATATRDLTELLELGALTKRGERKYTRYYLNIDTPALVLNIARAIPSVEPGDPDHAEEIVRAVAFKRGLIEAAGGAFDAESVRKLLGHKTVQAVYKAASDRRILMVDDNGARLFPAFQFDGNAILPAIPRILAAAPQSSGWTMLDYLVNGDEGLGKARPIDLIKGSEADIERVLRFARTLDD